MYDWNAVGKVVQGLARRDQEERLQRWHSAKPN